MEDIQAILRQEIQTQGSISFARFMEVALYCPDFGYYEREALAVGRKGDFYTSACVGPLFGELLASQFADWAAGTPISPIQFVEAGAHDGRLAADILGWIRQFRPELTLQYGIVEPSAKRRRWQEQTLDIFAGQVTWFASMDALPTPVNGVIFCNELLDAMPVHIVQWRKGRWTEVRVGWKNDRFVWTTDEVPTELPVPDPPEELRALLSEGFQTEVCLAATKWWEGAAAKLARGRLVAIDYGLEAEQFLAPERARGTLRAYRRHQLSADVLSAPGAQDITAHVNFSVLRAAGEKRGLRTEGLFSQAQFLTGIVSRQRELSPDKVRQFQTLTHPEHLGRAFKVLVQSP